MRKRIATKKLGRSRTARLALFRSQVRSLVINGKLKTTLAKAKFVQGRLDKLVTLAKKGDIASVRRLIGLLGNDKKTAKRLVIISKDFKRNSGFTRIVNFPQRRGDASKVAEISWVDEVVEKKKETENKKDTKKTAPKKTKTDKKASKATKAVDKTKKK